MSFWQEHDIETRVLAILRDVQDRADGHHL